MDSTEGAIDHELRQTRLSTFGRVLAVVTLGFVATNFTVSIWLRRPSYNRHSVPLLAATVAFAALRARGPTYRDAHASQHRHRL